MQFDSFFDELGKIAAARWRSFIRSAKSTELPLVARMYRGAGVRPPASLGYPDKLMPGDKESWIKGLSALHASPTIEVAPRGSDLWRRALSDIKNKRMVTLETGTSRKAADQILREGPSGPINLPFENMGPVADAYAEQLGKLYAQKVPGPLIRAAGNKMRSGLYANPAGTKRTSEYAGRAAGWHESTPATLRFDLPQSMARLGDDQEFRVPRELFQNWARNKHIL